MSNALPRPSAGVCLDEWLTWLLSTTAKEWGIL
jgi:hypothetical protein